MKNALRLADEIIEILRQGLTLGPDVMHFIDSTFGTPSADQLKALLEDESDSEAESLSDLVFFPDEAFRVRIEDLLESHDFQKDEERCVQDRLASCRPETILYLPDGRGSLTVAIPPKAAARFVPRLRISKTMDASILDAINESIEEPLRRFCKVRLRQSRFPCTPSTARFLARLFKAVQPGDGELLDRLCFLFHFIDDMPGTCDLFEALSERKRFYIKQLYRIEAIESQIVGKNMETMVQQGLRVPYLDKTGSRKKIRWIDEICLAVFNKTDYFIPA